MQQLSEMCTFGFVIKDNKNYDTNSIAKYNEKPFKF